MIDLIERGDTRRHDNMLRRLFGRATRSGNMVRRGDRMHTLVANQIQNLVDSALTQVGVVESAKIVTLIKHDSMEWFELTPRRYGESGSAYGHANVVAKPGGEDPTWPTWVKQIPVAQLSEVGLVVSRLSREQRPLGGFNMDEENLRRAVYEFADHITWNLLQSELTARASSVTANR
jgi:hypothetical protein